MYNICVGILIFYGKKCLDLELLMEKSHHCVTDLALTKKKKRKKKHHLPEWAKSIMGIWPLDNSVSTSSCNLFVNIFAAVFFLARWKNH